MLLLLLPLSLLLLLLGVLLRFLFGSLLLLLPLSRPLLLRRWFLRLLPWLGLPLGLGMLRGLSLLVSTLLWMVLLFAVLLLCVNRNRNPDKQRQNGCAGDFNYFHKRFLHC